VRWFIACLLLSGCYAEWDVPKVPRKDPCSDKFDNSYIYFMPGCRHPASPTGL